MTDLQKLRITFVPLAKFSVGPQEVLAELNQAGSGHAVVITLRGRLVSLVEPITDEQQREMLSRALSELGAKGQLDGGEGPIFTTEEGLATLAEEEPDPAVFSEEVRAEWRANHQAGDNETPSRERYYLSDEEE